MWSAWDVLVINRLVMFQPSSMTGVRLRAVITYNTADTVVRDSGTKYVVK